MLLELTLIHLYIYLTHNATVYQVFFSKADIRSTHKYGCLISAGVQEAWGKRIHN